MGVGEPGRGHGGSTSTGPRVGVVLGGGGMAGYGFHAATLDALHDETGFDARTAELLVGTSAGAILAALMRGGISAGQVHRRPIDAGSGAGDFSALRLLSGRSPGPSPGSGPGRPLPACSSGSCGEAVGSAPCTC